jgi:hypothetical protein
VQLLDDNNKEFVLKVPIRRMPLTELTDCIMPPTPVFPDGTLEEQSAAAASAPKAWYVVLVGFRVGVYNTWTSGAKWAIEKCPSALYNRREGSKFSYEQVVQEFIEAVQAESVSNARFTMYPPSTVM